MKKSHYHQQNNYFQVQKHSLTPATATQPNYYSQMDTSSYSISRSTSIITKRLDDAQQRLHNLSKSISKSNNGKNLKKEHSKRMKKNKQGIEEQHSYTPYNRQRVPQLRNKAKSIHVKGFETDSSQNQTCTQEKYESNIKSAVKDTLDSSYLIKQNQQLRVKIEQKISSIIQLQKQIEQLKNYHLQKQSSLLKKQTSFIQTIHALEDRIIQLQQSQSEIEAKIVQDFDKYRVEKQNKIEQLQKVIEQQYKQFEKVYQKVKRQDFHGQQQSLILQTQRKSMIDSALFSSLMPLSHRCAKCQKKSKIIEWLSDNYRTLSEAIKNWSHILNRQQQQGNKKSPISKRKIELPITVLMMQQQMQLRKQKIEETLIQIGNIKEYLKKGNQVNTNYFVEEKRENDKSDYPLKKSEFIPRNKQNCELNGNMKTSNHLSVNGIVASRISDSKKTEYSISRVRTQLSQPDYQDYKTQTNELFQVILAQAQLLEENNLNSPFSKLIKRKN